MKTLSIVVSLGIIVVFYAYSGYCDAEVKKSDQSIVKQQAIDKSGEKAIEVLQKQKKVIKFNNKICPVMGRKVNGKNFVIYKGIRYEVCCGGCEKMFPKNPEKYLAKLSNNGKIIELNNTTCPVMGGKVNKKYWAVYNGIKVYFCCPECISKFNKDPEKYLKKLNR